MNGKHLLLLAAVIASVYAVQLDSVYAHKSEVVGDYKLEIGWDREPPIIGMENAITVMITHASDEEKASSDKDHSTHDVKSDHSGHEMDDSSHNKMDHSEHIGGISGLADSLDVSITLNGKKTILDMVEDEHMAGLYHGKFTPQEAGHPTVSFFAEIDGAPIETTLHPEKVENGALIKAISSDGTINVDVIATAPTQDQSMLITIDFVDSNGKVEHVNYALTAMQSGANVLSEPEAHAHHGTATHSTTALKSGEPVDVQITILGIGLPDKKSEWTGPKDDIIPIHVTPEFGPITMIVMGIALLSLVGITGRTKLLSGIRTVF